MIQGGLGRGECRQPHASTGLPRAVRRGGGWWGWWGAGQSGTVPCAWTLIRILRMSMQVWTILSIVSVAAILGILHVMASWVESETQLQELRRRVQELRAQRVEKMRELAETRVKVVRTDQHKSGGGHSKAA